MKLISQEDIDTLRKTSNQSQPVSGRKFSTDDDEDDELNQNSELQNNKGTEISLLYYIEIKIHFSTLLFNRKQTNRSNKI